MRERERERERERDFINKSASKRYLGEIQPQKDSEETYNK